MDKNTKITAACTAIAGLALIGGLYDHNRSIKAATAAEARVKTSSYALNSYQSICENARPDAADYSDDGLSIDGAYCGRKYAILTLAVQDGNRTSPVYVIAEPNRPERTPPTITAEFPSYAYTPN